ncbi:MAG: GGDEF domain-containing protein [Gammaproteobacteria bacterium]
MNKTTRLARIWHLLKSPVKLRNPLPVLATLAEVSDWRGDEVPQQVALRRQQSDLTLSVSLVMSLFALLELLLKPQSGYDKWYVFSVVLSGAFLLNAVLAWRGLTRLASYLLPLFLALFVAVQISQHTGMSWIFLVPPVVLFLHPLRRGLMLLAGMLILVMLIVSVAHVQMELRGEESFEFIVSILILVVVCAIIVEQLQESLGSVATVAFRDPLTGLYRRSVFDEFLSNHLKIVQRSRRNFALLMLDIDNFKTVNDLFGHTAGDALLRQVGELLRNNLRAGDIAARYGGDEFLVLLSDCPVSQATEIAERLRAQIDVLGESRQHGGACRATVSMGIAVYPGDGDAVETLFEAADRHLLAAKQTGKDHIVGTRAVST